MSSHPLSPSLGRSPWLTRDELALLDRVASEEYGLPTAVLMENAGRGAAEAVLEMLADPRSRTESPRVVLLAGPGNNGGDACVVARHLANAKVAVEVVATRALGELRGDAAVMRRAIERMEIPVHVVRASEDGSEASARTSGDARGDFARASHGARGDAARASEDARLPDGPARRAIERATLLVDGLLGTGFRGAMRAEIADLVRAANARRASGKARTVALDLPSGLDADSGLAASPTIEADATVTFAARKKGFEAREALPFLGQVVVASIGAPDAILERLLRERRSGSRALELEGPTRRGGDAGLRASPFGDLPRARSAREPRRPRACSGTRSEHPSTAFDVPSTGAERFAGPRPGREQDRSKWSGLRRNRAPEGLPRLLRPRGPW